MASSASATLGIPASARFFAARRNFSTCSAAVRDFRFGIGWLWQNERKPSRSKSVTSLGEKPLKSRLHRQPDRVGAGRCAQPLEHQRAVHLDGLLGDPERMGDLLVQ